MDASNLTTLATLKKWLRPQPSGGISAVMIVAGGEDYASVPTVTVTDTKGVGAVITAVLTDGVVTDLIIEAQGNDYISPVVAITGGGGTGATAVATIDEDEALQRLITGVSNTIVGELPGLVIEADTEIAEVRDGQGGSAITLRRFPATTLTSISIDGRAIPVIASAGSSGCTLDTATNAVRLVGYVFSRGVQNVEITYDAGLPDGDPRIGALEEATLATAAMWWMRNPYAHLTSQSAPQGMGTSSGINTADFPAEAWRIIRRMQDKAVHL